MRDAIVHILGLGLTLLCYGSAFALGQVNETALETGTIVPLTFGIGCAVLAALSIVMVVFRKQYNVCLIVLTVKTALVLLIGIPIPVSDGREELLFYGLTAECLLYLPNLWGSAWCGTAMFVATINQQEWKTWDLLVPAANAAELFLFAGRLTLVILLATIIKGLVILARHRSQEVNHLERSVQSIVEANLDLQTYAVEAERRTTEAERKRITREIHDIIGYSLTSQLMMLEAGLLIAQNDPPQIRPLLKSAKHQLQESLEDIRTALHELRSPRTIVQNPYAEFEYLCRIFSEATGVRVEIQLAVAAQGLEEGLFRCLYRIIQQGLTNAFFHGRAGIVEVLLSENPDYLMLTIIDNGRGADEVEEGIGMKGMRERLESYGGDLNWVSSADGFRLMVKIPRKSVTHEQETTPQEDKTGSESIGA